MTKIKHDPVNPIVSEERESFPFVLHIKYMHKYRESNARC